MDEGMNKFEVGPCFGRPWIAETRKDVNKAAEQICKLIEEKMKPTAANSKL